MKTKYQIFGYILFLFLLVETSPVNAQFWKKIAETIKAASRFCKKSDG